MAQIKITPEELRSTASTLDSKRGEIESAVSIIESKVNETTANWEGAAQSAFVTQFMDMLPMLKEQFPQAIEGISQMMNGAAEAMETADSEIASAFNG